MFGVREAIHHQKQHQPARLKSFVMKIKNIIAKILNVTHTRRKRNRSRFDKSMEEVRQERIGEWGSWGQCLVVWLHLSSFPFPYVCISLRLPQLLVISGQSLCEMLLLQTYNIDQLLPCFSMSVSVCLSPYLLCADSPTSTWSPFPSLYKSFGSKSSWFSFILFNHLVCCVHGKEVTREAMASWGDVKRGHH